VTDERHGVESPVGYGPRKLFAQLQLSAKNFHTVRLAVVKTRDACEFEDIGWEDLCETLATP